MWLVIKLPGFLCSFVVAVKLDGFFIRNIGHNVSTLLPKQLFLVLSLLKGSCIVSQLDASCNISLFDSIFYELIKSKLTIFAGKHCNIGGITYGGFHHKMTLFINQSTAGASR